MYQESHTANNSFQRVENQALSVSFGFLIATGVVRKENARELLIELGIYRFIDVKKQQLVAALAEEVISVTKKWESPNDGIYKMGGAWWMLEAANRCDSLSCFFTPEEQYRIAEKLLERGPKLPD